MTTLSPGRSPTRPPRPRGSARSADWPEVTFRRRGRTVLAWLAALVVAVLLSMSLGGDFTADYSAPGSDSKEAQTLLEDRFPTQAGDTVDVVVRADGGVQDRQQAVQDLLAELGSVAHVVAVSDPFQDPAGISQDGTTLVAHLRLDVENPVDMPHRRQRADARDRRRRRPAPASRSASAGRASCRPSRVRSAPRASAWPRPRSSC